MIIVCNSMPKSGSSLLRYYVREMINHVNPKGQEALIELIKTGVIKGRGHFVDKLDTYVLKEADKISKKHGPVLVKVHLTFNHVTVNILRNYSSFLIFNYRDPRDVILSAMDHHKRSLKSGNQEFSDCSSFEIASKTVLNWSENAVKWIQSGLAYNLNYEYFLNNRVTVLEEINKKTKLELDRGLLKSIIQKEEQVRRSGYNQYNTGKIRRFEKEMTNSQVQFCNHLFKAFIPVLCR